MPLVTRGVGALLGPDRESAELRRRVYCPSRHRLHVYPDEHQRETLTAANGENELDPHLRNDGDFAVCVERHLNRRRRSRPAQHPKDCCPSPRDVELRNGDHLITPEHRMAVAMARQ